MWTETTEVQKAKLEKLEKDIQQSRDQRLQAKAMMELLDKKIKEMESQKGAIENLMSTPGFET